MMVAPNGAGRVFVIGVSLVVALTIFTSLSAQDPQTSPGQSPAPSPSVSPSASPVRTPSPTPLPGAQNFHQWGSITVFNGLPSDAVRAIAQTPDGVMWFGTDNGLARFDGRRIQNFSLGTAESDRILALEVSPSGELWIGTRSGGFVRVDNGFHLIAGTEDRGITVIFFGRETLLGTTNGNVMRVAPTVRATPILSAPIQAPDGTIAEVTGLAERDDGVVVTTAGRGALLLQQGTLSEFAVSAGTPGLNALVTTPEGALWLGTDAARNASGVQTISSGRAQRVAAPTARVLSLETNDGGVWAGTERSGLFQFDGTKLKKTFTFANTSGGLRSDTIYALFTDREGVLWIGTNRGASRFDQQGSFQQTVSDIPNSNFIRTICLLPVEGEFFYAGSNRGLFRNTSDDKWLEVPGLRNRSVYAIGMRNGSTALIGTADGLYNISGRKLLDGDVRSFARFRSRDYAAVFGRGLFDITTDAPQLVLANESITSISGRTDRLLIGTNGNGLYSYDGKTSTLEVSPDALKSGVIWKIGELQEQDDVWIAGQHGVFLIRKGTPEQIIAAEDVRDLWVDPDEVWAATTTQGLIHARRDERFGWLSNSIGFEQGLPSEKAFSILPLEGGFLIGTNRGIVSYAPGDIGPKLIAVRALSQRVHDLAELSSTIALDYPQNSLLVEVAGQSSRTFPEEFQYAFVLKNAKGEEIARQLSNDPQYAPADLRAGEYTIEAIAFNRDLLASDPLVISFSVAKAPFPLTATALGVLLVLALGGLAWAIVEHRRIVQRNRELAAARLDLANEAERERRRIARDLHDQTLADLRNLMILSDAKDADPAFRTEIENVSGEVRRICEDLSPSVLENVGLVAALQFALDRTIEKKHFSAADDIDEKIEFGRSVQIQIYRIVQEVLTNIRTHSTADMVEMDVEVSADGKLILTIDDNGSPFEVGAANASGRGISNIRSRASLINATVSWKRRPEGNRFSITVPPAGHA